MMATKTPSLWTNFPDKTGLLPSVLSALKPPPHGSAAPDELDRVATELERQAGVLRYLATMLREVE